MLITPVIMLGGTGKRLWPQSCALYPKQFLPLVNGDSLLQNTLQRLTGLSHCAPPILVANEAHRFIVAEQTRQSGITNQTIILEPVGRNTAPAVALAALKALTANEQEQLHCGKVSTSASQSSTAKTATNDPVLLVLAADHVITNPAMFHRAVNAALPAVLEGKLATFGVVPTYPETGYGYIKVGHRISASASNVPISAVAAFTEKPDRNTAKRYAASGDYYWNAGMFLFTASSYLRALKQFRPDILQACQQALADEHVDGDFTRLDAAAFQACPSDSIDYAVMEKTDNAVVVPLNAGWSDIGSWSALWAMAEKDRYNNAIRGNVIVHNTKNCFIQSEKKLIATVGIDNLIIVESDDAILIADKDQGQAVKHIVNSLNADNCLEAKQHGKMTC